MALICTEGPSYSGSVLGASTYADDCQSWRVGKELLMLGPESMVMMRRTVHLI